MTYEAMRRLFLATDTVLKLEDYDAICGKDLCPIAGPVTAWKKDIERFERETEGSDEETILALSQEGFGGIAEFIGNDEWEVTEYSGNETVMTYAESLLSFMELPTLENERTQEFETKMINSVLELKYQWETENTPYHVEIFTFRSAADEMTRAVNEDLPLIPVVFVTMTIFSCLVFGRRDPVKSRAMLGAGSILCIFLSIMSGFGFCFIIGIPFTSMTEILPFVIFGVG